MKKYFIILFATFALHGFSQSVNYPTADSKAYEQMKRENKIPQNLNLANPKIFTPSLEDLKRLGGVHPMTASITCNCYIPPDGTYTLAMPPNDDLSTNLLSIPFTFCLYGTNYNSLYINNNGNISFGSAYSTFSSSSFPDPTYIMVAPFWGDVDTQGTGVVEYKITPTAMYVNWVGVGYYNAQTDKVNTFQLIITNGADPILPAGNNIAFCYGDMQWTTGSASQGVNGFGGIPATVGVNQGGVGGSYIQMGRFDQPGLVYNGPYASNDGVGWLSNKSFYFNSCSSTNIAPIASGLNNCDTIKMCGIGDTLILNGLFLAPEIGQNTTVTINLNGMANASVLNITNGNSATAQVEIIGASVNAGMNVITFTATDNGTPVATTVVNVHVFVDTTGISSFNPHITGSLQFCQGSSTTLSVSPTNYDSYYWESGASGTSITVDSLGSYWVTASKNGCQKTTFVQVTEHPLPTPAIVGTLTTCKNTPTFLSIDSASLYTNYHWSNSHTTDSISVISGTFTVTVTDPHGCVGVSPPVTVLNSNPTVTISGTLQFCPGDSTILVANPSFPVGASYVWSNSANTLSIKVKNPGTYYVSVNYSNACDASDTVTVLQNVSPIANFTETPLNASSPTIPVTFSDLSTVPSGTITSWNWNFGDGNSSFVQHPPEHTYTTDGIYTVTLAVQSNNGCWDTIRIQYIIRSELQVPNVFSPNGDGVNDLLVFKNLQYYPNTSLEVYDRWGIKVYESSDYQNNWNGGGHSDGVYYYLLTGSKLKKPQSGFVEIVR